MPIIMQFTFPYHFLSRAFYPRLHKLCTRHDMRSASPDWFIEIGLWKIFADFNKSRNLNFTWFWVWPELRFSMGSQVRVIQSWAGMNRFKLVNLIRFPYWIIMHGRIILHFRNSSFVQFKSLWEGENQINGTWCKPRISSFTITWWDNIWNTVGYKAYQTSHEFIWYELFFFVKIPNRKFPLDAGISYIV